MSDRWRRLLDSDLIGIPTTIAAAGLVAIAIVLFFVAGPAAGLAVGIIVVGLGLLLVSRLGLDPGVEADVGPPTPADAAHRLLVVANKGLANPALVHELQARSERGPLAVRLIVPVHASSALRAAAGDLDAEASRAQARLDNAIRSLEAAGIEARGHVDDEASPMAALVDGLRESSTDEVILVPADELDWEGAEDMGAEVQRESGVPVTEIGA